MTEALTEIAEALLTRACAAGATEVDIGVSRGVALTIDTRDGALESAERAEGIDVELRLLVGKRQAIVSASDASDGTLNTMVERAVAMAREAPEEPSLGLAEDAMLASDRDETRLDLNDPATDPSPAQLQEMALQAEACARAQPGVSQVQTSSATLSRSETVLLQSNGFSALRHRSGFSLGCLVIAGSGVSMTRDSDGDSRTHLSDLRSPEDIGRSAAERAVAMQGARRPPSGRMPVIFDERISGSLMGHLLAAINGQSILRGGSWARDLLGELILPPSLSLREEPHRPRTSGARLFDAEGLPTVSRDIISEGRIGGWILDLATARRLNMPPTGQAGRAGGAPSPSVGNLTLTPGMLSRDELIRETGQGLLVTSLLGSTINPNTGDYSRGAAGFMIENGEISYPVQEFTIAGNLRDMLPEITPANDARVWAARRIPSLRVASMAIAGA